MKATARASGSGAFAAPGYGLLLTAVGAGMPLLEQHPRWALVAAAVVFGWSQIGGL